MKQCSFIGVTASIGLLSYSRDRWAVSLNVDNVFDKVYVDGSEGNFWLFTGELRGVKVSLGHHF